MDKQRQVCEDWRTARDVRREMQQDWQALKRIKAPMSDGVIEDSGVDMILLYLAKKGVIK